MRNEIGSEFWSVPICDKENNLFNSNTQWFISGRSALNAIITEAEIKSIAIPEWCCESIILPFVIHKIPITFYDALNPTLIPSTDAILVMDYFGFSSNRSYKDFPGIVIRDITHSLLCESYNDADYYFGSLRKWAGFYTGGFAVGLKHTAKYKNVDSPYSSLRKTAMEQKQLYINNNNNQKGYLEIFEKAEKLLDELYVSPAAECDIDSAKRLDIIAIKKKRRENAQVLLDAFADIAIFSSMKDDDCPLFVPIRVENRNALRSYLIKNEIYCPIHWPICKYHKLSKSTNRLLEQELSLVCDQRYDKKAMQRIIDTIHDFQGDEKIAFGIHD